MARRRRTQDCGHCGGLLLADPSDPGHLRCSECSRTPGDPVRAVDPELESSAEGIVGASRPPWRWLHPAGQPQQPDIPILIEEVKHMASRQPRSAAQRRATSRMLGGKASPESENPDARGAGLSDSHPSSYRRSSAGSGSG